MASSDELVTIDHFFSLADAELARAALEASGIDAVLDVAIHGGVRLQVRRGDAPLATAILTGEHLRAVEVENPEHSFIPQPTLACRRCSSEEVYPTQDRRKFYAQSLVFVICGIALLRLGEWLAAVAGLALPREVFNIAFLVVIAAPFVAALVTAISPRMRCRNCGLEWR